MIELQQQQEESHRKRRLSEGFNQNAVWLVVEEGDGFSDLVD